MKKIRKISTHIIAEIGVNHNGNLANAKKLIKLAKTAGANSVKLQTYDADSIVVKDAPKAKYQLKNTNTNESQYSMLKKYQLTHKQYLSLISYSKKIDIELFSTACDLQSLFYIHKELKFKKIKISSADLTNIPLLLMAGATKRKIILSSGMANIDEIDVALSALSYGYANGLNLDMSKFSRVKHKRYYLKNKKYLFKHITLLHCTSDYPAALDELNLNAIETLKSKYEIPVGYSDHSNNLITPIIAVSKNIEMIEVHITLDNSMSGPDHICSLNMIDFKKYVKHIRKTEIALGSFTKKATISELKNMKSVRKSLTLNMDLLKGERVTIDGLTAKRPEKGIPSINYTDYIGKIAKKSLKKGTFLKAKDLKAR